MVSVDTFWTPLRAPLMGLCNITSNQMTVCRSLSRLVGILPMIVRSLLIVATPYMH